MVVPGTPPPPEGDSWWKVDEEVVVVSESHQQAISKRLMDELTAFEESTHREFVS